MPPLFVERNLFKILCVHQNFRNIKFEDFLYVYNFKKFITYKRITLGNGISGMYSNETCKVPTTMESVMTGSIGAPVRHVAISSSGRRCVLPDFDLVFLFLTFFSN